MNPQQLDEATPFQAMRRSWQPVALSAQLAENQTLGATLLDQEIVIARIDGQLLAAPDACPHKGFRLSQSSVCGRELQCAYHGWRFDAGGACTSIPSLADASVRKLDSAHLRNYAVQERYGFVWVQLEPDAAQLLPEIPELEAPDWSYNMGPATPFECGYRREIENFLDMTHFAFAHGATLGMAATHTLPPMEIQSGDEVVGADVEPQSGPKPDFILRTQFPSTGEKPSKLASAHARLYRTWLPNFTAIRQSWPDGDERLLLHIPSPVSREKCVVFWSLAISPNFDGPPAHEQISFAERVLEEDRLMCENQRPREVPVVPQQGGWGVLVAPGDLLANTFQKSFRSWLTQSA